MNQIKIHNRMAQEEFNGFSILGRSLWLVRCILAALLIFSLGNFYGFYYLYRLKDGFGDRFRELPGAFPYIGIFLLQGILGSILCCLIFKYISVVKRGTRVGGVVLPELMKTWNWIWTYLALAGLLYSAYCAWWIFGVGPVEPSGTLTPRFKAPSIVTDMKGIETHLAEEEPDEGLIPAVDSDSGKKLYLHKDLVLKPGDIRETRVVKSPQDLGGIQVNFVVDESAIQRVRQLTAKHRNKPIAVVVNGRVVAAPIIREPIGERGVIGGVTFPVALRIAKGLVGKDE